MGPNSVNFKDIRLTVPRRSKRIKLLANSFRVIRTSCHLFQTVKIALYIVFSWYIQSLKKHLAIKSKSISINCLRLDLYWCTDSIHLQETHQTMEPQEHVKLSP